MRGKMPSKKDIILVTGTPRSGTTAVGQYLSMADGAAPLHEPMNGITGLRSISRHYEIPGTAGFSDQDLEEQVQNIRQMKLRYKRRGYDREPVWRKLAAKVIGHRPHLSYLAAKYRPGVRTLVWKDPFALFIVGHPAMRDIPVVATVRNPFAVAASYKRMAWGNDVDEIAERLKAIGLWPTARMPKSFGAEGYSPVENAALLWDAAYAQLLAVSRDRPNIHFVDIDKLIADPLTTYRRLYDKLGLGWTDHIEAKITAGYSSAGKSSSVPKAGRAHDTSRNVSEVNSYWTKVMSEDEINMVQQIAQERWDTLRSMPAVTIEPEAV